MFRTPLLWISLLLVAMLVYLYWPEQNVLTKRAGGAPVVEVAAVTTKSFGDTIQVLGNVQANEAVTITTATTDRITKLHFEDGQTVKKGQLLVTLEHQEENALIKELTITIVEQKRQLKRLLNLKKQSASAQSEIDTQRSAVETSEVRLQSAKIRLNEQFTYAPFDGVLGLRQVSPGQLVKDDTAITTLDDISVVKVEFQLPEKYLTKAKVGQQVFASNVAYVEQFVGTITSIDSRVDAATRAFNVRATFDNPKQQLRPGMLLQLSIIETPSVKTVVPESAIVALSQQHYVYVLQPDNRVIQTLVELGTRLPGLVEIVSGLELGQQVVHKGVLKIRNGSKVKVAEQIAADKGL